MLRRLLILCIAAILGAIGYVIWHDLNHNWSMSIVVFNNSRHPIDKVEVEFHMKSTLDPDERHYCYLRRILPLQSKRLIYLNPHGEGTYFVRVEGAKGKRLIAPSMYASFSKYDYFEVTNTAIEPIWLDNSLMAKADAVESGQSLCISKYK